MPELPEVETIRRYLAPVWQGRRIARVHLRRPDLRFAFAPDFRARLEGQQVTSLGRRAKYLLADLESGDVLVMHLGMTGAFFYNPPNAGKSQITSSTQKPSHKQGRHDHVAFSLSDEGEIVYNDPRRFGFMKIIPRVNFDEHRLFRHLGVEPTGNGFTPQVLARACAKKHVTLKSALMDQRVVAGLGNIYVCEALFRARLSPLRQASTLMLKSDRPASRTVRLVDAVRAVIDAAIAAGGSTLSDFVHTDGTPGYFQHEFLVYGRKAQKCLRERCSGRVKRIVQSGRSTFYCPRCQR